MDQAALHSLFQQLFTAGTEKELQSVLIQHKAVFDNPENWKPLGNQENNFAIIKNQQSSPIAALVEKVTNSIDAILMKKCRDAGIDPDGDTAPRSMELALQQFFPNHKDWDLQKQRRAQAEEIQILADGKPRDTSVVIYDNGEGQHPADFETTFLSLIRGNKNKIHFVQGKYNMGGSGAIVFCGDKGYQLIASKRYSNDGNFGFTLVREHPMTDADKVGRKETWYEYLVLDGKIPSFPINSLDLGLKNRAFKTGTVIKLYSYQFPPGYSGFAQELNQSLNEFLFKPLLPVLTADKKERYPNNRVLERDFFGLWRRLEQDLRDYLERDPITEVFQDEMFGKNGKITVTSYVFAARHKDKDAKETREHIEDNFFKNGMAVLFSLNGQVHGAYKKEFFSRAGLNLLRDYVLVHVDCTAIDYDFRKELFMASRDRLKEGREATELRDFLRKKLGGANSPLKEIERLRKDSISAGGADTAKVIEEFSKNLPMNSEMMKLLSATFKLEQRGKDTPKQTQKPATVPKAKEPFVGKRFPTFLKIKAKEEDGVQITKVPIGGEHTLRLNTDVENNYFNRTEEPGSLKLELLDFKPNESNGGNAPGAPKEVSEVFNVHTVSPQEGTIKVNLGTKDSIKVGDRIQIKATLTSPDGDQDALFWVKITEPDAPQQPPKEEEAVPEPMGLPQFKLVWKEPQEGQLSWNDIEGMGKSMKYETVLAAVAEGDVLEAIYVNMNSSVLQNFKSKYRSPSQAQLDLAERKYSTSVYFHALFLYAITRNRRYKVMKGEGDAETDVPIESYLEDLFTSYYCEFILNFGGMEELMAGLAN